MEETKKKEKKGSFIKKLKSLLALVLVVVVSVLGTLAYLQYKTDSVKNTFTGSDDISLKVVEPNWEKNPGYVKDSDGKDTNEEAVDSNDEYNTNDTDEGEELAKSYTPGLEIPKDPKLVNNTDKDYEEWVAIRVDYFIDDEQKKYADFACDSNMDTYANQVLEGITFNTRQKKDNNGNIITNDPYWIPLNVDGSPEYQVYVYSHRLGTEEANKVTEALFEKITINKKITKKAYTKTGDDPATDAVETNVTYQVQLYPSINIFVTGGAIKVEKEHDDLEITTLIPKATSSTTDNPLIAEEIAANTKANAEIELIKAALLTEVQKVNENTLKNQCQTASEIS